MLIYSSTSDKPSTSNNLVKEMCILSSILVGLLVLADKPYGIKTFLKGLAYHDIFSVLLLLAGIGIVLIMLQRLGIIFADFSVSE